MSGSDYVPSPLLHQPAFRLPGGKNVTVWIGLHVEYWSRHPPAGSFVRPSSTRRRDTAPISSSRAGWPTA